MNSSTGLVLILVVCLVPGRGNAQSNIFQPVVDLLSFGSLILKYTLTTLLEGPGSILSALEFLWEATEQFTEEPADELFPLKEYDFVIVGGGTAGCVLANRLTENANTTVLLIEAGNHEFYFMDIPLLAYFLQKTPVDWQYKTEPSDKYCTGFINKQCNWPRGKVLGGSSVLNIMMYTRSSPQDYDNWLQQGNVGWGWKDVLPFFKKIENFKVPTTHPEYHGYDGYLSIEHARYRTIPSEAWVEAAQEAGYTYSDYNGAAPGGVSFIHFSMLNGTRHSSSRAYLHPINKRPNLHVVKSSLATEILFDEVIKTKVTGVIFNRIGIKFSVRARKEVIVSAGAINSPQLLMLSGIGPKAHLEELGIPVVQDLPVGDNLQDHIAPGGLTFRINKHPTMINTKQMIKNFTAICLDYANNHNGPLSTPGAEAINFMNTQDRFNITAWPDMELFFLIVAANSVRPMFKSIFGFTNEKFDEVYSELGDDEAAFMVTPMLLRPKSKGRVYLKNRDPDTHPLIDPNYFACKEDMEIIIEGIKAAIDIANQPSMKNMNASLYDQPIIDCLKEGPFGSDKYWACHTRTFTFTIYHYCGTCKMGTSPESSVVDPRLRVHNISGLRVVDASIFPEIPAGHTNAPTYMVAEKASHMIKEDWGIAI